MKPMTFAAWVVLLVFVGGGSYAQESDVQAPAAGIQQNMKALHESETGGSPVVLEITFQKLADGPNYPARQVVTTQFDGKKIVMVETRPPPRARPAPRRR